jgi:hypothetical protein
MPRTAVAAVPPADNSAPKSDTTTAKIAEPAVASASANSGTRTIQEQVAAATTLAEQVTAATSPSNNDNLVALLIARPEIKSVPDLANKDIAIADSQSASSARVRTAIAAAGATEAQLSESHTRAIDRLVGGEVPAAVLALVSPEAAEWFPDIKGFKIFRVPLSPGSVKAHL